jgi:hypothetical protein
MSDPPIPVVPVLLNALYPPNQPTPARCLEIGEGIARAVAAFPSEARVGVVASGGLSHFVVDEGLDAAVVRALTERSRDALTELPVRKLNSGNARSATGSPRPGRSGLCGWTASNTCRVTGPAPVPVSGFVSPYGGNLRL